MIHIKLKQKNNRIRLVTYLPRYLASCVAAEAKEKMIPQAQIVRAAIIQRYLKKKAT